MKQPFETTDYWPSRRLRILYYPRSGRSTRVVAVKVVVVPHARLLDLLLRPLTRPVDLVAADPVVRLAWELPVANRRTERADRADAGPLAEIFARAVTDGIYRFLLPGLAGPHRLVPVRSLADSELSGNALAVAAKRGRLRAVRRTDQWYSTRQWVQDYKDSRYKRA